MKDAARRYNSTILFWYVNKLRGNSQSKLVPVKDRNGATISDKETVKGRWVEHLQNVLNRDRITVNDIGKMKKLVTHWL